MALKDEPVPKQSVMPAGADRRTVGLWFGLLAGPFAALADVGVSEAYVEHAEGGTRIAWLLVFAALAALVCVAAGVIASRHAKPTGEGAVVDERVRFMATAGVLASAFSFVVVLALLVPKLILPGGAST
jgi:hypothetical protein